MHASIANVLLAGRSQWRKRPCIPIERPTSPRIVTSKQHSKHTWMRPIVLSIHSFINIPITLLSPHCMVWILLEPFSRGPIKKPREQYLGSLKEPFNKTIEDRRIFQSIDKTTLKLGVPYGITTNSTIVGSLRSNGILYADYGINSTGSISTTGNIYPSSSGAHLLP